MDSSSSSRSRNTQFNGECIKFRNEWCKCNKKATVRISESVNNPHRLFFKCESETCNFFKFWEPRSADVNWTAFRGNTTTEDGVQQQIVMEVKALGGGVQTGIQTLHLGLQELNNHVAGMKMLLVMCFCISLVTLLALALVVMKH